MNIKYYIVENKADDYGNCKTELVQTTPERAKEYYNLTAVADEDVATLSKYFEPILANEEAERTHDQRFYGSDS